MSKQSEECDIVLTETFTVLPGRHWTGDGWINYCPACKFSYVL
jgi:hypothetical protein